jgi:hypothetical protein
MSTTLNQLVRDQILAEGPDHVGIESAERYINEQLHYMPHSELLERISVALEDYLPEMGVRLGI